VTGADVCSPLMRSPPLNPRFWYKRPTAFNIGLSSLLILYSTLVPSIFPSDMASLPNWEHLMRNAITAHGPLPQSVKVTQSGGIPMYQVAIQGSASQKDLADHPLSPKGRAQLGILLKQLPTELGNPKDAIGVAHPPISYKPSEWTWESPVKGEHIQRTALAITTANKYLLCRQRDPFTSTAGFPDKRAQLDN
jgi:hypothetical protein